MSGYWLGKFFPEPGSNSRQAKRICNGWWDDTGQHRGGCPVRGECLAYALANGEIWGVWGGMSDADRSRLPGRKAAA